MTYEFQKGERVSVPVSAMSARVHQYFAASGAQEGAVLAHLPHSGMAGADGVKADRVRVRLDAGVICVAPALLVSPL